MSKEKYRDGIKIAGTIAKTGKTKDKGNKSYYGEIGKIIDVKSRTNN